MVKVGLIGAGYWGKNYIRTVDAMPRAELGWVYNKHNSVAEGNLPSGAKFTRNYEDILSDSSTDAVIIATPPETHYKIAKAALDAGKDVLVEKPMTYSSDEALELYQFADTESRILMVGHIFLYNQAVMELKGMVDEGELGELVYLESRRMGMAKRTEANAMWCLAPHDISIANHLFGDQPVSVSAEGKGWIEERVEDTVRLHLKYDGGMTADIYSSWAYPEKVRKTMVVGTGGMAVFDDMAENKIETFELSGKGPSRSLKCEGRSPLESQCAHFFESVETGSKPLTSGENGYDNVRVLEAAQRSLETGKTIYLT